MVSKGPASQMIAKEFRDFELMYTIYILSRKSNLTQDYTTQKMATDYAELIRTEFGGKVDTIIGISYGGCILQHFAADYPTLADHMIIAMAANTLTPEGLKLDLKFAELLSRKKFGKAYALMVTVLFPNPILRFIMRGVLFALASFMKSPTTPTFAEDILIEARVEAQHDARENLRRISIPILILGGELDYYFSKEAYTEMKQLIPQAELHLYPKRGHDLIGIPEVTHDIINFIQRLEK